MRHMYPSYDIDLTREAARQCCDIAVRLLDDVGFRVPHPEFLSHLNGRSGIRIVGDRVHFDPALTERTLQEAIASWTPATPPSGPEKNRPWKARVAGVSMNVVDLETDEIRSATRQDLRDGIRLVESYGIEGNYPVMPQDLPPLMRAIACFKICYEMSDRIRPFDYQHPAQTGYLCEMHRVMGKPFHVTLCVPTTLTIDAKDLDVFLKFYPEWKKRRDIQFSVLDYPMGGITKPITVPGCATMVLAETLAVHMLMNLFDPELQMSVGFYGSLPTDMRNACWAFGSPRRHLFTWLNARLRPRLCGYEPEAYWQDMVLLETSSAAMDEHAAFEKMAQGLLGALQGARSFYYAGSLCVDDLFGPVQFVMDLEMVEYIRQVIEAFAPHPDIVSMDGLYEECRQVALGNELFISTANTASRFRNIHSTSARIVREKLASWLSHRTTLKDRARQEARERIRTFQTRPLPGDKQLALDEIYSRAERELSTLA